MAKETEDKQRKRRAKLFGKDGKKDGKKYDKTKGKTERMPEMHIIGEKPVAIKDVKAPYASKDNPDSDKLDVSQLDRKPWP